MAVSVATAELGVAMPRAKDGAVEPFWPLWCALGSSLAAAFGTHWDIAWHRSIGRDGFWTPPHVAIYTAAVLAALAALAQILPATFGRGPGRDAAVRVLGFRGPLGAFIGAWGGVAMLSSAPFDDWWHNAYGLDVKILSPPHVALALGILGLHLGALVMLAGAANRSAGARRRTLETLVLIVGGNILVALMTLFMEKTVRPFMHLGSFYFVVGLCVPVVLTAVQGATGRRWAASTSALAYSIFLVGLLWTFPLVPAQPKLGPVLVPVTCLIPPEFPLLLLPAALALDTWFWRRRAQPGFATTVVGGLAFALIFLACQWPFATFLMSPPARNFFWGARYFDFWMPAVAHYRRYLFLEEPGLATVVWLAAALLGACLSVAAGRATGRWLARLSR
ncbi:MAG TPA: hypothetical protein VHG72_20915 [Polyangia bacterium]|nr:hypothetical protein [Polyangia bacterium]